ncbi:type VI secretion system baseplate subunit TssG [Hahella ganghwensis]|uniref:type VI secretion system baseplate subunit TssG n=1 Tax=Hahella ganghwensis TaxID=286420 RepID=UPI0003821F95|nr:type VI secretion system baseplate subunit TssG [Hahella ganghwensis]
MAAPDRKSTSNLEQNNQLIKRILRAPWRYDFFQLVRLLEHYRDGEPAKQAPLGSYYPPKQEPLRFSMNPSMSFEAKPVEKVSRGKENVLAHRQQWDVHVNFWGLVGSRGILPFHYRELVLQRVRHKDSSMKHFFDMLDHRTLTLYYRAWKKYRIPLLFEANQRLDPKYNRDRHAELLKGLLGIASKKNAKFYEFEGSELNTSGLMSRRVCSPAALEKAIAHHFGLKVRILPFRGQWQLMPEDVRTKLGDFRLGARNHVLGEQAILGERTWAIQNRFTVQFEDIDYDNFLNLLSGTQMLGSMYGLIRTMSGVALDFDLALQVKQRKLPTSRLAFKATPPLLGWNTRLQGDDPDDNYIDVAVSRHAMQRTLESGKELKTVVSGN